MFVTEKFLYVKFSLIATLSMAKPLLCFKPFGSAKDISGELVLMNFLTTKISRSTVHQSIVTSLSVAVVVVKKKRRISEGY